MQTAKEHTFDGNNLTGEGRSLWPVDLNKEVTSEKDETSCAPNGSSFLVPTFFTVHPEDIKDSTPIAISLGSRCTVQFWYKLHPGNYIQKLWGEEKDILPDDCSNKDPIQIKIKHAEEGKRPLLYQLYEVYSECSKVNWDGYEAIPVSKSAYFEAIKLIESLPSDIPEPAIIPEPTGEIAFEWYNGKRFVFVISVGGKSIITYAGIFGKTSKTHGTEYFANNLPLTIIKNIQRLFL